jgi:hypothetical protein
MTRAMDYGMAVLAAGGLVGVAFAIALLFAAVL